MNYIRLGVIRTMKMANRKEEFIMAITEKDITLCGHGSGTPLKLNFRGKTID